EVTNVEILSYILLLTEGEDLANSIQGKSGYKTDVGLSGLVIDIPLNKSKFYCDVQRKISDHPESSRYLNINDREILRTKRTLI
ncbi:6347_t:CDS:2, partial [Entrophospora sp. SA101]